MSALDNMHHGSLDEEKAVFRTNTGVTMSPELFEKAGIDSPRHDLFSPK